MMSSQSTIAPDNIRIEVKLAASMVVCLRAIRHSSELPANAIMDNAVKRKTWARDIEWLSSGLSHASARFFLAL
jgi:hypothetical protein